MSESEAFEPEVLFSVAGVACLMGVRQEAVRDAVRRKRLQAEVVLVGKQIGVSTPLLSVAELWNLPRATVKRINADAKEGIRNATVLIVTPLILQRARSGERSAIPLTRVEGLNECAEAAPNRAKSFDPGEYSLQSDRCCRHLSISHRRL